ncbi:MAG: hypothetical protein D6732_04830 [Methanobacteriota archaeon]|nr:MAG: hypothetical protein D6732_04830 [Euryarchaeota archaeon]
MTKDRRLGYAQKHSVRKRGENPFVGELDPEELWGMLEKMSWHKFEHQDLSFVHRNMVRSFLSSHELKIDFRKYMELLFEYFPEEMEQNQGRFDLDGFKRSLIMEGFFDDKLPSVYPAQFVKIEGELVLRHRGTSREDEMKYYFRLPHFSSQLDIQESVGLVHFIQVCNSYMLLVISEDPKKITPSEFVLASILTVFVLRRHWGLFYLAKDRDDDLDALFMVLLTPLYRLAEYYPENWVLHLCLFFRLAVDAIVFGKVNIDEARAFVSLVRSWKELDLGETVTDAALKLLEIEGHLPAPTVQISRRAFGIDNFNQIVVAEEQLPIPYLFLDGVYLGSAGGHHYYYCAETFGLRHFWSIIERISLSDVQILTKDKKTYVQKLGWLHIHTIDYLRANLNDYRMPFPDPLRTVAVSLPNGLQLEEEIAYDFLFEIGTTKFYLIGLNTIYDLLELYGNIRKTPGAELIFY